MSQITDRLRCWARGKYARIRSWGRVRWGGHCWGEDGRCMDCGIG